MRIRLLAASCLSASVICSSAIYSPKAIAGNAPVALPDSGSSSISDTFSPRRRLLNGTTSSARISYELIETLKSLQSRQQVDSISSQSIQISSEQLGTIGAATYVEAATDASIEALEQQLMAEIAGLNIAISTLEPSPQNLSIAITASNELVAGLSSEQLNKATQSPTFMALLQMLSAANRSVESDRAESNRTAAIADRGSVNILKLSQR